MLIKPDNPLLQYSGRIDWSKREAPVFVFPCSYIKMKFTGTRVAAVVENHKAYFSNFLGCFIDGEQKCVKMADGGRETITLAEGLENCEHELMLFKRMDSCHIFTFYGFEVVDDARLGEVEAKPARRIKCTVTVYPRVRYLRRLTILGHDAGWDRAIGQVCEEMGDEHIHHFLYSRNGVGTPGHIRIPEAEEMAAELTEFIESLGEEIWA